MKKKPHVVIIMADHLRIDCVGPYTPRINELAEESVTFERAYCASPLCVPARGSFFTGKYPNVTGSLNNAKIKQEANSGYVRREHTTLYDLIEDTWDSWHTGKHNLYTERKIEKEPETKTHWLMMEGRYEQFLKEQGKRAPGGPAFRTFIPETVNGEFTRRAVCSIPEVGRYEEEFQFHVDGFITKDTLTALRDRDPDKPLFLNAMYFAPHPPFDIPDPWYSRFENVPMPSNVGMWGRGQSPLQMYNLPGIVGGRYSRSDWQKVWDVFTGYVSMFDECVGQIIDELKRQGIYDDTLIVFTSDHGEMLGSHRMFQKMCMYEESVRIPLMFKLPNSVHKGKHIDKVVSAVDVLPTLCDALGIASLPDLCGRNLMPLIQADSVDPGWDRETVFIQYDGNGSRGNCQRCIVHGQTKLIVDYFKDEVFLELYRLEEDPQEMNNLAFDESERSAVEELLAQLSAHMDRTGDDLRIPTHVYQQFIERYANFV